jgi:hypothetical protein
MVKLCFGVVIVLLASERAGSYIMPWMARTLWLLVGLGLVLYLPAAHARVGQRGEAGWEALFNGKSLANWRATKFVGENGAVTVENGQIVLATGRDLTGITWAGAPLPTTNYELALQAMRVEGSDFFAGLTFPVGDSFCSLILGGWGGTTVGLSSINGRDASDNDTTQSITFESGRWYAVRLKVTAERIEAWLDDRPIVNQALKGNTVSTRIEVDRSQPLGVASWRTKAALREIRLRRF